jgi:hypothetical protein
MVLFVGKNNGSLRLEDSWFSSSVRTFVRREEHWYSSSGRTIALFVGRDNGSIRLEEQWFCSSERRMVLFVWKSNGTLLR